MPKRALILTGGWPGHEPEKTSAIFRDDLAAAGFEVVVAATLDALLEPALARRYDVIIPNWTMGELSPAQETALLDAVKSGTGLAGFHGGMGDAFRQSTGYQFMTGGQFVAHPDNHKDYLVHIVKRDDPVMDGLDDFRVHSEQYYMHVDPSNTVLATTTFQSVGAPWVNGTVMPVVWKRRFGQGRVFYSALGHNAAEFAAGEAREIARRGMIWAAN